MRLSWGQGAVVALVAIVAAGMLELPSRVLGPARALQAPINLPQSQSPAVVLASPPVRHSVVVRHKAAPPSAPAAQPIVARIPAPAAVLTPAPPRAHPAPASPAVAHPSLPGRDTQLGRERHLAPRDDARRPAPA